MAQLRLFLSALFLCFGLILHGQTSHAQVLSCPQYQFESSEFSFKSFNPRAENILNIDFPGNSHPLYRGAYESNPQFSFEKALSGLFMEKNWHIGSPMFFGITQVLNGSWTLDHTFFPSGNLPYKMRDYFEARDILDDIEFLLACQRGKAYSQVEAEIFASDLMNKTFSRMSRGQIEARYFNIMDPDYYKQRVQKLGFGNNATDLIISSAYDLVAALYGSKILVLEDKRKRALDLSFFNFKKNNLFFHHWVDNGEMNAPGYIVADELIGYQQRKVDRLRVNWAQSATGNPIDFAAYRIRSGSELAVLILDASDKNCITQGSDNRYYPCNAYWKDLMTSPVPYPTPQMPAGKIPLMGIIVQCDDGKACPIYDKINKWYGKWSQRSLEANWIQRIQSLTVNGKKLIYKPALQFPNGTPKIDVVSATYVSDAEKAAGIQNNATAAAAEFLNGKQEAEYKISTRYLKLQNWRTPRTFEIQWKCLNLDQKVRSLKVNQPAENKKIHISCLSDSP